MKTNKKMLMMIIMMVGSFIAVLNNVLLNNALPMIMQDLEIEAYSTVQWLTTAYMLVAGILIPTSAYFITKFKSNHVFIFAMSIFSIGTLLGSFSVSFSMLLTARIIQAIGASVLSPLLMNVMIASFSKKERGKAMGMYGLVIMFAPSIGPTISGLIVDSLGWRWLFIGIAPFALLSLGLAIWKLDNVLEQRDTTIDFVSVALSTLSFSSILYGFNSASSKGWSDVSVYGLILFGVIMLALFAIRQFKIEKPLLDLRVYSYPMFTLSSILSIILSIIMYSAMIILPYYLQTIQGNSVLVSGLVMLPGSLLTAFLMPISGRLFDRYGMKPLALVGFPLIGISTYFMSILTFETSLLYIGVCFIVRNVGTTLIMMPLQANGLNQLPNAMNPSGTAINSTIQQVAGAIGTSIFVTIMTTYEKTRAIELKGSIAEELIPKQALLDAINHTAFLTIGLVVIAVLLSLFIQTSSQEE